MYNNFSWALDKLKSGEKLTRIGWEFNTKKVFIVVMSGMSLPSFNTQGTERKVNDRTAKWIGKDTPLESQPYIALFTAQQLWQPGWIASQVDLFAEDWVIAP